jgi:hypothetical protein
MLGIDDNDGGTVTESGWGGRCWGLITLLLYIFDLQLGTDGDRRTLRGDRGAFGPHRFFKQDLVTYNFMEGQREQLLPPNPFYSLLGDIPPTVHEVRSRPP